MQSRDPETGRITIRRVLQAIRRSVDSVITLELASAKGGPVLQKLTGTPDHPIFTPRGQVPLSALGIGTEVISRAGPNLVVRGIIRRHEPSGVAVYNLDVEADHTYFVGASAAAWVHNGGPCPRFEVVRYDDKLGGHRNHHGVMDAWAKHNIPGYRSRHGSNPSVRMPKKNHDPTIRASYEWLDANAPGRTFQELSPREIKQLSDFLFDAAKAPMHVRDEYYSWFTRYIYSLP